MVWELYSTFLARFWPGRGVASGTASRALALLDFWLAGPIKLTFPHVFLAPLPYYLLLANRSHHSAIFSCTRVDSGRGKTVTARALTHGPGRIYRLATPLPGPVSCWILLIAS